MKQSPLLTFESTAFEIDPGEDARTNPTIYGEALAGWPAARFRARGLDAGERPRAMRPCIALLAFAAACASSGGGPGHSELNVMNAPPVCDSVPPPVRPGEQLGATMPEGVGTVPDSAIVVGTLTEVATARTLGGARVALLRDTAFASLAVPLSRAYTNAAGGFVLRGMPGTYTLDARRIGGAPLRRPITLRAGVVDTLRLEMGYLRCSGY